MTDATLRRMLTRRDKAVWAGMVMIGLMAGLPTQLGSQNPSISITPISTYETRIFDQGASEIVAYDPETRRLFVVNAAAPGVDVLDVSDPTRPRKIAFINAASLGGIVNGVDVSRGLLAVAVEATVKQNPGVAAFYRTSTLELLGTAPTGALPDMIRFSPNGRFALTANEGEPNAAYTVNPEGSVTVINVETRQVTTIGFSELNGQEAALRASGIRIYGPGANTARDFEPEYIAVSPDSSEAYVTLQENNAIAVLDLNTLRFTRLLPLGYKDHSRPGNAFDASDRDGVNIANWPVFGMYQPDSIAAYTFGGRTYLVTANEGDAREYTAFAEEVRVSTLRLDPVAFPNAAFLTANGRLTVTRSLGDTDSDGDFDRLFVLGGRSFSIWDTAGNQVFDSGDAFERITAQRYPAFFNASSTNNTLDDRSDNKGPEPEGLVLGEVGGRTYAFIGLERIGGVMIYDITDPRFPTFVDYVNNRNFNGNIAQFTAGDLAPEGLIFIPGRNSPNGGPMLVVGNETSGTTTLYNVISR